MSLDGILLIDKPSGFTSFDVIAKLRGMTKTRKIGHAGTLDPMATGVLPVLLGRAAKAADLLPNHDKAYIAGFKLGVTTDTQDTTGRVLSRKRHSVTADQVCKALELYTGELYQTPPMYSAVRVNGRRLYDIARSGGEIERRARKITVYGLMLLDHNESEGVYTVSIKCSRGTYIRTLCHDIGEELGCGAAVTSLRRTAACGFDIADCITLDSAQVLCDSGGLDKQIIPVAEAFADLPELVLDMEQTRLFLNGAELRLDLLHPMPKDERLRVNDPAGRFLGLASPDINDNSLRIIKLFYLGEKQ